jgi:hypothetical protein
MSELRAWLVYRINWLRARAKKTRWAEEAALIPKEMGWTVNFFNNKVCQWEELQTGSLTNGQRAYASKQCAMWRQLGERATVLFNECRTQYNITSA